MPRSLQKKLGARLFAVIRNWGILRMLNDQEDKLSEEIC